ncbi:hypothetical protein Tco_0232820 [Tanacetum coccineum]
MKCNPTAFHGIEGAVELQRWFEKTESVFGISKCVEGKKVTCNGCQISHAQGPCILTSQIVDVKVIKGAENSVSIILSRVCIEMGASMRSAKVEVSSNAVRGAFFLNDIQRWDVEKATRLTVYIDQSIVKDVKVIKELKKVFSNLTQVCNEMGASIEELQKLKCSSNAVRSAFFLNDIQRWDVEKATRLFIMIKQLHLKTSKKVSFLRMLKGFWSI